MNWDSDIWLADVVRTLTALRPGDSEATAAIMYALGFRYDPTGPGQSTVGEAANGSAVGEAAGDGTRTGDQEHETAGNEYDEDLRDTEAGDEDLTEDGSETAGLELLQPLAMETGEDRHVEGWRAAKPLERVSAQHLQGIRDHEPLLAPGRARSIIAATVATWDENGPVDVDRLIDAVTRTQPITRLPRRRRPSLTRGVQLLVDAGKAMEPFARDQQEFAVELRQVVGRSRVAELRFRSCPTRGAGTGPTWTWRRYRPPSPGTPVVVLTDLGIGGPRFYPERGRTWEWRALNQLLARRACPLIAFVPYPASRWPPTLLRSMTILPWDRTTTISTVRVLSSATPVEQR